MTLSATITAHESLLAECGLAIDGHGFSEDDFGNADSSGGWNGLAAINAVTLLNVGETDLSERFRAAFGEATLDVWVNVNGYGHKAARAWTHGEGEIVPEFRREEARQELLADAPTCQWFAKCTNLATDVEPHPVLDYVPICGRCQERVKNS